MEEDKRTNKVMEKWGVDDEMNKENIRKAAEMYARIQVNNRMLKKIAIAGVSFMVVFIGLMLGSVILGAKVSQDVKVKNDALVSSGGNGTVLETAEMFYSVKLDLLTPLNVLQGLKSLKFVSKKDGSIIQFTIVSFYHIPGRVLRIYGHNHMANVLADGNVEFFPINNIDGGKRIEDNKMTRSTDEDDLFVMSYFDNLLSLAIRIYSCAQLEAVLPLRNYALMTDLTCTLNAPLLPLLGYFGKFNGFGHTITLNMNRNGPVALFSKVRDGAVIANLFIAGTLNGKGNCSAFAVEAYKGSKFLSSSVYANITCGNINNNLGDFTNLGGFAAVLRNPSGASGRISFKYCVNQGFFHSESTTVNKISYTGGFYGRTGSAEYMDREFSFTYSATNFTRYGNNSHVNRFGFKYVHAVPSPKPTTPPSRKDEPQTSPTTTSLDHLLDKRDPYIPEDCYGFDDTNIDYFNMCVDWYGIYWYENPQCCQDYFNSCPYWNPTCFDYPPMCQMCPITKKKSQEGLEEEENKKDAKIDYDPSQNRPKYIPTVQKLCGFN